LAKHYGKPVQNVVSAALISAKNSKLRPPAAGSVAPLHVDPAKQFRTPLSVSSVQRIWRAFGLQPHRMESFKLSTDPDFVAKVRDVVGLYVAPPEHAIVLCVDEKSQDVWRQWSSLILRSSGDSFVALKATIGPAQSRISIY
jgi:hypothetical protein